MKIARTLVQPIRVLTAAPLSGLKPSLFRQVKNLNRSRSHFTRVKPIEPFSDRWFSSPSRPPRKRSPERFEKQYERLDHLVPLDANHSKFLSDLAEPGLFLEKDFDALQELEEAQRQLAADGTTEMVDNDVAMTDYEEPEDVEMTDVLQPPRWVYWWAPSQTYRFRMLTAARQGDCPPPEFFLPFPHPSARADILQQARKAEVLVSTTACDQVAPEPSATPSDFIPEPDAKDEVAEYFENLEYNIANGIVPPNIDAEAMYPAHPPAATLVDEQVGVEHAQSEDKVVPDEDEREAEPAAPTESKLAESPAETETGPLQDVPNQYRGFLEEAMNFSAEQMKPPPEWWKRIAVNDEDAKKGNKEYVVRSFTQYASWPSFLQVQPQFHCPDPKNPEGAFNTPASCRLSRRREKEERERFSDIRKDHPEVWEAIIGTMLQEGVSIDNMLLCHEGKDEKGNNIDLRPQVLDNQKWCVDNWRFDNLAWHTMQGAPLAPDCSPNFHKAPKRGERSFHETIAYLKSHPESCYLFRILVSEWLESEWNQATFRMIARKAGWCPVAEHQLQRDFIKWVFADADATPMEIFGPVEKCFPERYPRFFAATIEEEGIDYL
ncbi:uncharacterized protein Z520_06166 [Fonsecaea multimorphosa CBS 102226]|uniref:Uncharacterized protein n=1 Tax=Fonsecaea multimorphosa CBS 102226 TaxID=1442371 RepID=A0A0D2IM41_9EURO|nr:uncharacterized protein Z520_06166 [Fonsecaea multimorphosa CBS 102226]KIX98086.1 hypothetical protein Z520_06166 [Fonsecaea multimorphosa CBS 102226]